MTAMKNYYPDVLEREEIIYAERPYKRPSHIEMSDEEMILKGIEDPRYDPFGSTD